MTAAIDYHWRGSLTDGEMLDLTRSHGGAAMPGWWTRIETAISNVRAAGCEWLHVDFTPDLAPFYFEAAGFRPTDAGLVHLTEPS